MEQGQVTDWRQPEEAGCTPPRYGSREYHGYCGCRADKKGLGRPIGS